jgi:hypothetical protein
MAVTSNQGEGMAKRRRRRVGRMSGLDEEFRSLTSKVEAWKRQRAELADGVRGLIESAQALLKDLGDDAKTAAKVVARPSGPRPRRRRFSKAARAKMAAAMKRRWAEAKKAGKKKL